MDPLSRLKFSTAIVTSPPVVGCPRVLPLSSLPVAGFSGMACAAKELSKSIIHDDDGAEIQRLASRSRGRQLRTSLTSVRVYSAD